MSSKAKGKRTRGSQPSKPPILSEDWLAVILAFLLILLSAVGLLGPNGIKITF